MSMDYETIMAITSVVAAIVAIWAIWAESRRARFALSSDMIFRLYAEFNSDDMRDTRKFSAQFLLEHINDKDMKESNADLETVLDFFEMMGLLTRRGALDKEMVWHTFFYFLNTYRYGAERYIDSKRKSHNDISLWEDMLKLQKDLIGLDKTARRCSVGEVGLNKESLREYLEEEINL